MGADRVSGRCYCGDLKFEIRFPTRYCGHCHCEDCRRSHSAAFVTWASVPETQFALLGGLVSWFESHPGVRWGFCGRCGSSLFYQNEELPNRIDVTVAALDGPLDIAPSEHVSFEEKVDWLIVGDHLPRLRGKDTPLS
ncbi:MAG: GFA family protein [Bdellovibrionota bacterium]